MQKILWLFLLFLTSVNGFSQIQKKSLKKGLAFFQNDTVHRKQGLSALPLLYYSHYTRWIAGLTGAPQHITSC